MTFYRKCSIWTITMQTFVTYWNWQFWWNFHFSYILKMQFCWEFCLFLSLSERYKVDEVSQDSREDCYLATLHIVDTNVHDSRPYYLVVENERGVDRHAINLVVEGMFTGAFLNFFSINYFFLFVYLHSFSLDLLVLHLHLVKISKLKTKQLEFFLLFISECKIFAMPTIMASRNWVNQFHEFQEHYIQISLIDNWLIRNIIEIGKFICS